MPQELSQVAFWLILVPVIMMAVLVGLGYRYLQRPDDRLLTQLNEATERFGAAVQHHVDVNAVVKLSQQFDENPQLLTSLSGYSRQVVGAALLYRVDSLASQLKIVQDQITDIRPRAARESYLYGAQLKSLESMATSLLSELTAADKAVQSFRAGLQSV